MKRSKFDYLSVNPKDYALKEKRKYIRQRSKKGYCDKDVWNIDMWFLHIMPRMLEELKKQHMGWPMMLIEEYYELNKDKISLDKTDFCNYADYPLHEDLYKKAEEWQNNRWNEVLEKMIFLFDESNEETCQVKNEFGDDYNKASAEFRDKYGVLGQGLATDEEREIKNGSIRLHSMEEVPMYKDINEKYFIREAEIIQYREKCKREALEMFVKYFDGLWD